MEVYFVDVGQGSCNVILIGSRKAIVIDTGRRAADLSKLLTSLSVDEIACLAISHLDDDHAGGASSILTEFRGRIDKVCYPNDHRGMAIPFLEKVRAELRLGNLQQDQLARLECESHPKGIWRSRSLQAELKVFSPTFGENQDAMFRTDANATSGVLILNIGAKTIVFPGDSSLEQWKQIRDRRGSPIDCDIIAVPHHGGVIWTDGWPEARIRTEMLWLYQNAVRPKYAVISAGTSNTERHPRPEVMDNLKALRAKIMCTQMTKQCCNQLETIRPGLLPPITIGRSSATSSMTNSSNSRDVACAGTIVADVTPTSVSIRRVAQHQNSVNLLQGKSGCSPICR